MADWRNQRLYYWTHYMTPRDVKAAGDRFNYLLAKFRPPPGQSRDLTQIDRILKKIRKLWQKSPDLRLLQLLLNAKDVTPHPLADPFYVEDAVLEAGLDKLAKLTRPETSGE